MLPPGGVGGRRTWAQWSVVVTWCVLLGVVIIGPLSGRGWVVLLDWVNGPRNGFADRIMSGAALPAGPVFYAVAAILQGCFGAAGGWLVPLTCLVVGGLGAARLAPPSLAARLTAATAYVWNPFVHERLYSGQVAVLMGAALLPWLATASLALFGPGAGTGWSLRGDLRRTALWRVVAIWAVTGAVSVHFVVVGGLVVLSVALARTLEDRRQQRHAVPWRTLLLVTVLTATATACWLVPIAGSAPAPGDGRTVDAFATRGGGLFELLVGTAGQSGFWRDSPGAPGPSSGWWWCPAVLLLGLIAAVGAVKLRRSAARVWLLAAGSAALGGWILGQGTRGPLGPMVRALIALPGMGIMREPGKFLVLVSLGWSAGLAAAAHWIARPQQRRWRVRASALMALVPVALTPGLAWGVGGRLAAVRYPSSWEAVRRVVDDGPAGALLVQPFVGYLDPGFTHGRVVRHPAVAFFGARSVISDDMGIDGLAVPARTRAIDAALAARDPGPGLARLGIRWVLVSISDPWATSPGTLRRAGGSGGLVLLETPSAVDG